jgi:hypothetical protein
MASTNELLRILIEDDHMSAVKLGFKSKSEVIDAFIKNLKNDITNGR